VQKQYLNAHSAAMMQGFAPFLASPHALAHNDIEYPVENHFNKTCLTYNIAQSLPK